MKKSIITLAFAALLVIASASVAVAKPGFNKAYREAKSLFADGAYSDAIMWFELSGKCSDAPSNNDVQSWIAKCNQKINATSFIIAEEDRHETINGYNVVWSTNTTPAQKSTITNLLNQMVSIDGSVFTMGATAEQGNEALSNEKVSHKVFINNFAMGKFEVTQDLWSAVMGSNPSCFKGDNQPVENVSWSDTQNFITKINILTGLQFALPTEAQWEYAARGGKYNDNNVNKFSGSNYINTVAWYYDSRDSQTHEVGSKEPNQLGLYDMSGNVSEWCNDWFCGEYYNCTVSDSPLNNPQGPSYGTTRSIRGGSWSDYSRECRVSCRRSGDPDFRYCSYGFRLVISL